MPHLQNSTICYACRRKKNWSNLGYDVYTLKTYCLDRRVCPSAYQPNHKLVPAKYDELVEAIEEVYPEEVAETFKKEFGKPRSVRLTPAQIMFLFKFGQRYGATSFSDAITQMVELVMKRDEYEELDDDDLVAIPWHSGHTSKPFGKRVERIKEKREQLIENQQAEIEEEEDEDVEGEFTL